MHVLLRYGMYLFICILHHIVHFHHFLFSSGCFFNLIVYTIYITVHIFPAKFVKHRSLRLIIPSDTSHWKKRAIIPPMSRQTHPPGKRQKYIYIHTYFQQKKSSLELWGDIMHVANCSPTSTTRHSVWAFQRTPGGGRWRMEGCRMEHSKLTPRELTYPPDKAYLKMIILFPRWDMLISWRVINSSWFILPFAWYPISPSFVCIWGIIVCCKDFHGMNCRCRTCW